MYWQRLQGRQKSGNAFQRETEEAAGVPPPEAVGVGKAQVPAAAPVVIAEVPTPRPSPGPNESGPSVILTDPQGREPLLQSRCSQWV